MPRATLLELRELRGLPVGLFGFVAGLILFAILLTLLTLPLACRRGDQDGPQKGAATGVLEGRLVSLTGATLEQARVQLRFDPPDNRVPVADIQVSADQGSSRKSRPGSPPRFRIATIPPGRFRVVATAPGHSAAMVILRMRHEEKLGTVLRLEPAYGLGGSVKDRKGQPVPLARVVVWPAGESPSAPIETRTDEAGRFAVAGLDRGDHGVLVEAPGLGLKNLERVPVPGTELAVQLDVEGRTLLGQVTSGGKPAGATQVVLRDEEKTVREVLTEGTGKFAVHGLGPGAYVVRALRPGHVSAAAQVIVREQGPVPPIKLILKPGQTITGTAVDDRDQPLADAEVEVTSVPPDDLTETAKTEKDGRWSVGPLPAGEYLVSARRAGHVLPASPRLVVKPTGPAPAPVIKLQRAARVSGRVVDHQGRPVPHATISARAAASGEDLAVVKTSLPLAAEAAARPSGQRVVWTPGKVHSVRSDRNGGFSLDDLPPGMCRLEIAHPESAVLQTEPVKVGPGQELDLGTITLRAGAVVTGRVLDEGGFPLDGAVVTATPPSGVWGGGEASSDRSGQFVLRLPQGEYLVEASAPGWIGEPQTVRLLSGDPPAMLTLQLTRTDATLEGSVSDTTGRPVARAQIWVWTAPQDTPAEAGAVLPPSRPEGARQEGRPLAAVMTDAGGHFRAPRVPKRPLVLEMRHVKYPVVRQVAIPGEETVIRVPPPGGIVGEVREKGTGAFIARYRLTAEGPEGRVATPSRTIGAGFELTRLHPGRWTISVESPGYARGTTAVEVPPGDPPAEPSVRGLRVELERMN